MTRIVVEYTENGESKTDHIEVRGISPSDVADRIEEFVAAHDFDPSAVDYRIDGANDGDSMTQRIDYLETRLQALENER